MPGRAAPLSRCSTAARELTAFLRMSSYWVSLGERVGYGLALVVLGPAAALERRARLAMRAALLDFCSELQPLKLIAPKGKVRRSVARAGDRARSQVATGADHRPDRAVAGLRRSADRVRAAAAARGPPPEAAAAKSVVGHVLRVDSCVSPRRSRRSGLRPTGARGRARSPRSPQTSRSFQRLLTWEKTRMPTSEAKPTAENQYQTWYGLYVDHKSAFTALAS